ncbi:MAG: transketolase [Desulfobacteraceae bacterium]|nr:MAG: transketolase [Desulfobacteraceae bacterium]
MSNPEKIAALEEIARLIRHYILTSTTHAGSGHPTSALSATELMTGLLFGGTFRFDPKEPRHPNNDRLIFSKGHASPLLYGLWTVAGGVTEADLKTYRQFGSPLEGHPTVRFKYAEAATGSLGQGLSIGVGMALNARYIDHLPYTTYVLLGDSEMAEGAQWEAAQIAAHYKLDNLVGILDVNGLGQRGKTLHGHDLEAYADRLTAFGWETIAIDGHAFPEILEALEKAEEVRGRPVMIIARTVKGKGVALLENKDDWHGKALNEEELKRALEALGPVDRSLIGSISAPQDLRPRILFPQEHESNLSYASEAEISTRDAYGNALKRIFPAYPQMVVLDSEVSNSTRTCIFQEFCPERFFEMYIAEQNMVGAALGLARRGQLPFVSTFGAFLTRAFDQIRMCQYSNANIKFVGSHAGVSIGEDGPSQMALEDIAMFRSIPDCVVLYPADAVSTERLVEAAAEHQGMVYIRTARGATPILYDPSERFAIGDSRVLRNSSSDVATVVAAGVTLYEALAAYETLKKDGILIRVIDLYSIQPPDTQTLRLAAEQTRFVITVEDHYPAGGIGETVQSVLSGMAVPVYTLAVRKRPMSGKPEELMAYEEISKSAIIQKVRTGLEKTA